MTFALPKRLKRERTFSWNHSSVPILRILYRKKGVSSFTIFLFVVSVTCGLIYQTRLCQVLVSPGHVAWITNPTMFLLVKSAAGLAYKELAVQTLALAVDEEFEGLKTADAERIAEFGLIFQQLSLCILFHYFGLQLPTCKRKKNIFTGSHVLIIFITMVKIDFSNINIVFSLNICYQNGSSMSLFVL